MIDRYSPWFSTGKGKWYDWSRAEEGPVILDRRCLSPTVTKVSLHWRHTERDGVSNHQHLGLFRRRSKKTSRLRVTGLWEGNPPVIGGLPPKRASDAEIVYIWWCHHDTKARQSTDRVHILGCVKEFGRKKTCLRAVCWFQMYPQ